MKITDKDTVWSWATDRCARRECCRFDVEQKLRETPLSATDRELVLDALEDEKYIDSARYARAFVHDKLAYDRWGRLKMQQALRLKRIPQCDITEAFSEMIEADAYREALRAVIASKLRSLRFDASDKQAVFAASQKLVRHAASRGFEADLIFSTIDEVLKDFLEEE